ncbi:MAG: 3'-5' exonuclease [Gammaproteobacteria bacterium]|nr:3'-5' exonuclease [Gammaproteobacteria bacterium]
MTGNVLAFDIETVPDVETGKVLYDLDGLDDADVIRAMLQLRRQKTGSDFLALHLHRIVAVSVVLQTRDELRVWSLGDADSSEAELIERFFDGLDRYEPTLVSWNGGGFDLPVLSYRALLHGVNASQYWEMGDRQRDFRYNNYTNRFHWRHVDMMDVLSHFQLRGAAPLDEVAMMLGFPGKGGMHGSKVADAWLAGEIETIRNYCETDALNTFLVWLRFEQVRGRLPDAEYAAQTQALKSRLEADETRPHLVAFAQRWKLEAVERAE